MVISGSIIAKCKECNCVFTWTTKNMPFIDSEFIGTCDYCIRKEEHVCIDETLNFREMEKKVFKEERQ